MTNLIIGYGEIGKGIHNVVGGDYIDRLEGKYEEKHYDIIHICIPYSNYFNSTVKGYIKRFTPKITIVHSTVPVGTCKKLGVVHSPVRGVHPHLEEGIRTFVKYFGGEQAREAAKYFETFGIKTKTTKSSNDTEALKLWSTTQYGAMILLNKEIFNWCKKHKVDFDLVYTDANQTYNEGYIKLGRPEVVRPVLKYTEGKIGGHCVANNTKLFNSKTTKDINKYQAKH